MPEVARCQLVKERKSLAACHASPSVAAAPLVCQVSFYHHLAHFKDAARLALEMGHTDTSMIFGHYRELVRPDEAAKYR